MAEDQYIHDPRVLRAIAHPVRTRILGEIAAGGPLRAADVARELDIPANQASFHLRQLAKYGLVEEAPGEARDKRDRVWKATSESGLAVRLNELEKEPGGRAAVSVFRRSATDWAHHLVDLALTGPEDPGSLRTMMNQTVKLTRAEAEQLQQELLELVEGWVERTRGRDDDERRTYVVMQVLQPYPQVAEDES
jgi:DNA-binding MarR family transcriptional regulator